MLLKTVAPEECYVNSSPTNVSLNEFSWILHPLDKASLGYCVPKLAYYILQEPELAFLFFLPLHEGLEDRLHPHPEAADYMYPKGQPVNISHHLPTP